VLVRYNEAETSAEAASEALIAATTCAAVLVIAPLSSVAACTLITLPATETASGLEAPLLTIAAVRLLPPSWPQAFEVSTTARGWSSTRTDGGGCVGWFWVATVPPS
jgi:hypothetical protein